MGGSMEPSKIRLTRDPLARPIGTIDGAVNAVVATADVAPEDDPSVTDVPTKPVTDGGRPMGTTKSMVRFNVVLNVDHEDPQNMDDDDVPFRLVEEVLSKFLPTNADRTNNRVGSL